MSVLKGKTFSRVLHTTVPLLGTIVGNVSTHYKCVGVSFFEAQYHRPGEFGTPHLKVNRKTECYTFQKGLT